MWEAGGKRQRERESRVYEGFRVGWEKKKWREGVVLVVWLK